MAKQAKASGRTIAHKEDQKNGCCNHSNLDECSDRLALNDKPFCETFSQIFRLKAVDGLEDLKPLDVQKSDLTQPFYAARANQSDIEKVLGCSMIKAHNLEFTEKHLKSTSTDLWEYFQRVSSLGCDTIYNPTFCQDIELAIAVSFEQCWYSRGYSRGELLSSISLTPGEEMHLEFFTYDRHKIERERENEGFSESSESASVTSRATTEVINTIQFKIAVGAEAKAEASLSLKEMDLPVDIGGEVGANFQSELSNTLTASRATLNEATINASNTLRNTRKTKIVEMGEFGSENRNSRKISNENRCHTVNYDYFEILENYWIEVRPKSAEYVVKVPLPDLGPITAQWLLCHEYPLRLNLLDDLYGAGFDAAKLLQSAEIFRTLASDPPPAALPDDMPPENSRGPEPDPVGDQLRITLGGIVAAKVRLQAANVTASDFGDIFLLGTPQHRASFSKFSKVATRDFILSVYTGLFDRIDELNASQDERGETLLQHFEIFLEQMQSAGVMNIVTRPIKWEALQMLVFSYDDEGLVGAIRAAQNIVTSLQQAVAANNASVIVQPDIVDEAGPQASPVITIRDQIDAQFGLKNLAEAQVELDRSICHIKDNWDYYLNVIFLGKGQSGVQGILDACPQISQMVETRFINISGGFALFALNRQYQQRFGQEQLNKIIAGLEPAPDDGVCVTLPTKGTMLEARLGECSACEPFIEKHRVLDLKAKQQELDLTDEEIRKLKAEADRYEQRLAEDPKLLDDPAPPTSTINVSVAHNQSDDS